MKSEETDSIGTVCLLGYLDVTFMVSGGVTLLRHAEIHS